MFTNFRRLLLGILVLLLLGALVVLGLLIKESGGIAGEDTQKHVASTATAPVSRRIQSLDAGVSESSLQKHQVKNKSVSAGSEATPSPKPEQLESLVTPVFYELRPEKIASLTQEQQWALKQTQEDYISYYNEWMRTYPRDTNLWNQKMKDFEQDLVLKLGPEGADKIRH